MDISPDVNLLKSLRGERIAHGVLIGEGVDNAFDADARLVRISLDEFAPARPNRTKQEPAGARKKTTKSGDVVAEKSTLDGPARSRRPPHDRLLITFDGRNEEQGVGEFQPGRPHRVDLSRDNPYVAKMMAHRDMEIGAQSLYALAIALFEQGKQAYAPQAELPFVSFGKRVADLLSIQAVETRAATG